jgi:hypothetical protein
MHKVSLRYLSNISLQYPQNSDAGYMSGSLGTSIFLMTTSLFTMNLIRVFHQPPFGKH